MSRRKKSHQSHGSANRPRFWGKHAVAAALDNPERKVLKAWSTREAANFMNFPPEVPVTFAEAPDLGRLVPSDAVWWTPCKDVVRRPFRLFRLLE